MEDEPQKRGKQLEAVLNDLFRAYGFLIREDLRRKDPEGAGVMEQIDGVIEFKGHIYLVEMKWVKDPVGVEKLGPHLVRLFGRDGARALFIAANGYADTAIAQCREALDKKVIALINLNEIVMMLEAERSLGELYSGPHVQDSFPPNLSCRADVHRSGLALPQPPRSGR